MSYIPPHLTQETSPAHVLINVGKQCVHCERSFWDRVVDLFSRDEEVRNRYQARLGTKMKSFIKLIQTEGVKDYIHHDVDGTSTNTFYRYSLGPDLFFECKFAPYLMTPENILFSLMQYATFSSPYKPPREQIGGINTVLIDRNRMPVEKTTKEVQIGDFRSDKYRFFSDGRYLYINNKLEMSEHGEICKMVFDFCLENRLHPFIGDTRIIKKSNQECLLIFPDYSNASEFKPEEPCLVQYVCINTENPPKLEVQLATNNINEIIDCLHAYKKSDIWKSLSLAVCSTVSKNSLLGFKQYIQELRGKFPQNTKILCLTAAQPAGENSYTWLISFYLSTAEETKTIVQLVVSADARPDYDNLIQEINQIIQECETVTPEHYDDTFLRYILEGEGTFDDEDDIQKFLSNVNNPLIEFTINDIPEEVYPEKEDSWRSLTGRINGQTIVSCKLSSRICTTGEYRGGLITDALKYFRPGNGISLKNTIITQYLRAAPHRKIFNVSPEFPFVTF